MENDDKCTRRKENGSTEATKIKQILQRYVIYISDQITVTYLNTEAGNRHLNIGG
jgi:hypothetical protein